MRTSIRFALSFVAAALAISAQAKIEPADKDLLPTKRQRILDRITSPEVGAKDAIRKTDALVCITLSPGWLDILAVTPDSARAKDLAEAIDSQLADLPGVETEYGTSGVYGVADSTKDNSKWFQKHAELTVQAGKILQNLKDQGFTPQVVLRIPKAGGMEFQPEFETTVRAWRYRILKDDETGTLFKASSDVTPLIVLGTIAMCSGFLIVAAIGFSAAVLIARKKSMDVKVRRNLYYKVIMGSTFGSMALHMPFFLWFATSGYGKVVTDSWMGTLSVSPMMLPVMIPLLFMPLVLKGITKSERELFGTGPSDVAAKMELIEKAGRSRRKVGLLFVNLPLTILFAGISYYAIQKGSSQAIIVSVPVLLILTLIGNGIIDSRMKKKEAAQAEPIETDRAEALAKGVADLMGVKLKKVVVNAADLMEVCIQATMSPTAVLTLSKGAVDKLTDDELRAVIAHECGHLKQKHFRVRIAILAFGAVLFVLAMATVPLSYKLIGRTTTIPGMFAFFILTFATMPFQKRLLQKQEGEADRLGLEATRDYLAIESAFQKLAANSPMPGVHDIDIRTHPAMGKRLEALRVQAAALGLPTERPAEEEEAALPPRY